MSNFQDLSWSRRSGKVPERSNFAQTCNLLSRYIKEKGGFRDQLSLELVGKLDDNKGKLGMMSTGNWLTQPLNSSDLLPQYVDIKDAITNNIPTFSKIAGMETKATQMTFIYGDQVLVFDDITADKAQEIMLFASKGSGSGSSSVVASASAAAAYALPDSGSNHSHAQRPLQPQSQATSDMPIARRASLHRFLEKRKDRVTARAPYQLHCPSSTASLRHEEELELKL